MYSKLTYFLLILLGAQEVVHKKNIAEDKRSRIDVDRPKCEEIDGNKCEASNPILPSIASSTVTTATQPNEVKSITLDAELMRPEVFDPLSGGSGALEPIAASYTAPGSSGTLKETHIFTPVKLPTASPSNATPNSDVECPDFDLEKAAAGVIIKENVVKKEYRDVEYDPARLKNHFDSAEDFSEFQTVEVSKNQTQITPNAILEPIKPSTTWTETKVTNQSAIDESLKSAINLSNNETENAFSGDFNKPTIGVSPSDQMFSAPNDAKFKSNVNNSSAVDGDDDEFTDFQSTHTTAGISYISRVSAIPEIVSTGATYQIINERSSAISSTIPNVLSTTPLAPTNILVPQVATTSNPIESKPKIDWPDPGISEDELARFEEIFPQPKTIVSTAKPSHPDTAKPIESKPSKHVPGNSKEEDEWSDFVSVAQPQLPITHILSQSLQKQQSNDEDDWTEFVSSTISAPTQNNCSSSGPHFSAWDAPSQFNSWQSSKMSSARFSQPFDLSSQTPTRSNGINHTTNGNPSRQTNRYAPSIISLPDLGFVAPKTLVNMPKPNLTKK